VVEPYAALWAADPVTRLDSLPLIALYFAVENLIYDESSAGQDSAIWILDPHALNIREIDEKVTPSIEPLMCRKTLRPAFSSNNSRENGKVCAVVSSEKDMRMFVQQGCFTIHSDRTPLDQRQNYLTKLVIPSDCVRRAAFEVDACAFRKGDLFPDLAALADEMKNRAVLRLV
jgi:hypothetical protein